MMFPSAVVSLDEQHNVGRSCSGDEDEDEDNDDDEDGVGRSSNGQSSRSSTSLSSSNSTITDFAISSTDNNNNYTENGNNNNNHKNNNNNNNDSNNNNNNNHNNNNNLIWYFSYGSNMNPNVFEKKRNITPKQTRVCYVPDYVLTFGEGALPYVEPAFCTCIRRTELTKLQLLATATAADTTDADNTADNSTISKVLAVSGRRRRPDIHGVAFLITKREYEHVLMTEGGWGWQEYRNNKLWNVGHYGSEEVNCIEINNEQTATTTITSGNNGNDSTGRKFKAYTLTGIMGDVRQRYDCNASKRYYDIVIDGAKTSGLPISYQNYLKTDHPPFELLTHHKSLSSIKLARSICCILSIPCIIMEIGSLSLCIKWNNYINGNNEQSSSGCVVNVNNNTSYYSIRRPPWIICKISYLYRYIILEILLSIIIEDIFNIPNGFKNENENNNDMIEIVEIEKKKKKKLKKNAVVQVVDYDVTKKVD